MSYTLANNKKKENKYEYELPTKLKTNEGKDKVNLLNWKLGCECFAQIFR